MSYEIYAIKYGHHERKKSENFLGGDPHDGPMPLDYFVWLIRGEGREIVVDTGFNAAVAAKRGRRVTLPVEDGLRLMQVEAAAVKDVVITHLHYDHVGNFDLFPQATFHLQDLEMQYATGRVMRRPRLAATAALKPVSTTISRPSPRINQTK
jgi:glyoxylase-like metal-dependent hydrolase (beta-lactamase superfamily II)